MYCWVCLERIVKTSRYLAKLSVRKFIVSSAMCAGHCPAERWRTRLRSNAWRAVTVTTAIQHHVTIASLNNFDSMIDKYQTGVFSTTCDLPTDAIIDCLSLSERWSCAQAFCYDAFLLGYCVWWFFGVFVVSTWQQLTRLSQADMILRLSNSALQPSAVVRNLGVYVDEQLSMDDRACHCQNVLLSPATNSSTTSSPRLWHTDTSVDLVVLGLL